MKSRKWTPEEKMNIVKQVRIFYIMTQPPLVISTYLYGNL